MPTTPSTTSSQELNLPTFPYKLKEHNGGLCIFDEVRKRWVSLTPEEWVRQHFVHFLISQKKYPRSHFKVETGLKVKGLRKRTDIVVADKTGKTIVLVECKAQNVEISQKSFDQLFRYSMALNPKYLCLSNGLQHYFCIWDETLNNYQFLVDIPECEGS